MSQRPASSPNAPKSFEVVDSPARPPLQKIILIAVGVAVFVLGVVLFLTSGEKKPAPATPQARTQPAAPAGAPPAAAGQAAPADPAKQAELNQQLQQLKHFMANPTENDATITVEWLSKKYGQPPEIIVRDLHVLTGRLKGLTDAQLVEFFNSPQNPWIDDPGYQAIIKFVSHRDYVGFVERCATLYAKLKLEQK